MPVEPSAIDAVVGPVGWTLFHSFWQGLVVWLILRFAVARIPRPDVRARLGLLGLASFVAMQSLTLIACLNGAAGWTDLPAMPIGSRGNFVPGAAPAEGWFGRLVRGADPMMPWLVVGWTLWTSWRLFACGRDVCRTRRRLESADPLPQPLLGRLERLAARVGVRAGSVRFVVATIAAGPGTIGWLRPFIFIPPALLLTMSPAQLEAIVAHELAHVLRRDYLLAAIQFAIEGVYTCNPFVRWIVARVNDDCEHCCDRIALQHVADPLDYAHALRRVAEEVVEADRLVMAATGGPIVARVRWILSPRAHERSGSAWTTLGDAGAAAAVLLAISTSTLASASAARTEARFLAERTLAQAVDDISGYDGDVDAVRAAIATRLGGALPNDVERSLTLLAATDHASSPAAFRSAFATLDEVAGRKSAEPQATARLERFLLHALGADGRDFSTLYLRARLAWPATYARLDASSGERRRLVNAARFESDRNERIRRVVESLSVIIDGDALMAGFLKDLAMVPAAQAQLLPVAASYNEPAVVQRLASLLEATGDARYHAFCDAAKRPIEPTGRSVVVPRSAIIVNRGQGVWSTTQASP